MLPKCIFLFAQVCYLDNSCCIRSDDRFLLLLCCPHGYSRIGLLCCYSYVADCLSRLLLSGDVELNPGPKRVPPSKSSKPDESHESSLNALESSAELAMSSCDNRSLMKVLSDLVACQKNLSQDISEIKNTVKTRFDALELRVTALENTCSKALTEQDSEQFRSELVCLKRTVADITAKFEDLENCSRRNNIIIHGLPEDKDENRDTLHSKVVNVFNRLAVDYPRVERSHRLGRTRPGRSRPVILKLLDFNDKLLLLKNAYKLKNSDIKLSEDFSLKVRAVRKKLWDASAEHRNNGSVVKMRFDHLFIDNVRYNWDGPSNRLIIARGSDSNARTTNASSSLP